MSPLRLASVAKSRGAGRRARRVLVDVELEVAAGELLLLHGPSGSGKTTLLAVAAGLLAADAGQVMLAGEPLHQLDVAGRRRARRRRLGFVFQHSNLLPGLDVLDNVCLAAALAGLDPTESRRRATALLAELGVDHLSGQFPPALSGGEEQRVAVARALVHRPALVLADEPTAMLDAEAGREVAERLRRACEQSGAAVVVATHDPRLDRFATRRVRLADGRLAA